MNENEQPLILFHSAAPWCATGYGQQTDLFATRFHGHGRRVVVSAHYGLEGRTGNWKGVTVLPGANDYGSRMLPKYIKRYEPGLVITLLDPWVIDPAVLKGAPIASWVPVDHQPLGEMLRDWFAKSDAIPIAMSRHGEKTLQDAGLDCLYVPHGIDTTVFQPGDKQASRERLGIPQDAFVIGMVAANADRAPSRKAWPEALRAYSIFRAAHPDAFMYLHTSFTGDAGGGHGVNIPRLAEAIGLGADDFRGTPQIPYELGEIDQDTLADIYAAFDVLLSPSYGEGFGIAPLEAQACGVPVIVSDFSAQPELCGAGWLVEGQPYWKDDYRAWWQQPYVDAIVDALEQAYEARGDTDLAAQARSFAETYDADRVYDEHWVPALTRLLPETSSVILPNRQQRRALAKAGV